NILMEKDPKKTSYVENGKINLLKDKQSISNKSPSDILLGDRQNPFYHKRTVKRIDVTKRKARSEIKKNEWYSEGYSLNSELFLSQMAIGPDTIERIDASKMTCQEFIEQYEKLNKPVILLGLMDNWKANERWNLKSLYRAYRNQKFKCGEDDDGYSVKLKMKYYLHYLVSNCDDSPLYIFDSGFGERQKTSKLLEDYEVPLFFKDDLFRYAADKRRPPYRWFVMGPARSGTAIHIDPIGTSAWNALIVGHKKWCLIHPSTPKNLVKAKSEDTKNLLHPDEAITWFGTLFPKICSSNWQNERFPVIHAIQRPGEVMFVPSGWWHVVMNLDTTIAVTQNFCSLVNLPKVWPKLVKQRPQLALHWLKVVNKLRPELIEQINLINKQNGISQLDISEP
ncbi:JmjC domain-containing protein, partial [Meloidogyne graminicola]